MRPTWSHYSSAVYLSEQLNYAALLQYAAERETTSRATLFASIRRLLSDDRPNQIINSRVDTIGSLWSAYLPRINHPFNSNATVQFIVNYYFYCWLGLWKVGSSLALQVLSDLNMFNVAKNKNPWKGLCLLRLKRALSGQKLPRSYELLTHVNACWISFAQEKKKHGYFYFSSSTNWC